MCWTTLKNGAHDEPHALNYVSVYACLCRLYVFVCLTVCISVRVRCAYLRLRICEMRTNGYTFEYVCKMLCGVYVCKMLCGVYVTGQWSHMRTLCMMTYVNQMWTRLVCEMRAIYATCLQYNDDTPSHNCTEHKLVIGPTVSWSL